MSESRILSGYEPASVLSFFEDICAIPHVSGDEKAIADYIEQFAKTRGLPCYRDKVHNVFVKLPASNGRLMKAPAVMLQGHTDMVGEKTADSAHNFATDGLKLRVSRADGADGAWISATDTTLGGDDGIAVAMMLAILDNPPEPHPAIECLFTVSEETGLEGAWAFDPKAAGSFARTMINLDSEAEGVITAGCSGGMRTDITVPVAYEPAEGVAVKITLDGFTGGHSGVEIHEGHTNAIKAMGRLLLEESICGALFKLVSINGGGKDNAIPRGCEAVVLIPRIGLAEEFCMGIQAEAENLRKEPNMIPADKSFTCTAEILSEAPALCMGDKSTHAVLSLLTLVRDGVLSMSAHVKGLVAHSRNLGIVKTLTDGEGKPTAVKFSMSTRSASGSHLDDSERELEMLALACTGDDENATHRARYPGWDYAPVSHLRDLWTKVSEEMYGVTPKVEVIHAGLECGILCDKLGEMDIISIGPDMKDIHTPREMLSIPSVERTYRLVRETLCRLA